MAHYEFYLLRHSFNFIPCVVPWVLFIVENNQLYALSLIILFSVAQHELYALWHILFIMMQHNFYALWHIMHFIYCDAVLILFLVVQYQCYALFHILNFIHCDPASIIPCGTSWLMFFSFWGSINLIHYVFYSLWCSKNVMPCSTACILFIVAHN